MVHIAIHTTNSRASALCARRICILAFGLLSLAALIRDTQNEEILKEELQSMQSTHAVVESSGSGLVTTLKVTFEGPLSDSETSHVARLGRQITRLAGTTVIPVQQPPLQHSDATEDNPFSQTELSPVTFHFLMAIRSARILTGHTAQKERIRRAFARHFGVPNNHVKTIANLFHIRRCEGCWSNQASELHRPSTQNPVTTIKVLIDGSLSQAELSHVARVGRNIKTLGGHIVFPIQHSGEHADSSTRRKTDLSQERAKSSIEDELIGYADADLFHDHTVETIKPRRTKPKHTKTVNDMITSARESEMESSRQHYYVLSKLRAEKAARIATQKENARAKLSFHFLVNMRPSSIAATKDSLSRELAQSFGVPLFNVKSHGTVFVVRGCDDCWSKQEITKSKVFSVVDTNQDQKITLTELAEFFIRTYRLPKYKHGKNSNEANKALSTAIHTKLAKAKRMALKYPAMKLWNEEDELKAPPLVQEVVHLMEPPQRLNPAQMRDMVEIFELIDHDRSGTIDLVEVKDHHEHITHDGVEARPTQSPKNASAKTMMKAKTTPGKPTVLSSGDMVALRGTVRAKKRKAAKLSARLQASLSSGNPDTTTFEVAIRVHNPDTEGLAAHSIAGFAVRGLQITNDAARESEMDAMLGEELERIQAPVITSQGGVITHVNSAAMRAFAWRHGALVGERLGKHLIAPAMVEKLAQAQRDMRSLLVQQVQLASGQLYLLAAEQDEAILTNTPDAMRSAHAALQMCTVQGGGRALTFQMTLARDPSRLWDDAEETRIVEAIASRMGVPSQRVDVRVAPVENSSLGMTGMMHTLRNSVHEISAQLVSHTIRAVKSKFQASAEEIPADETDKGSDVAPEQGRMQYMVNEDCFWLAMGLLWSTASVLVCRVCWFAYMRNNGVTLDGVHILLPSTVSTMTVPLSNQYAAAMQV